MSGVGGRDWQVRNSPLHPSCGRSACSICEHHQCGQASGFGPSFVRREIRPFLSAYLEHNEIWVKTIGKRRVGRTAA